MIGKHRKRWDADENAERELADVNEQELAKEPCSEKQQSACEQKIERKEECETSGESNDPKAESCDGDVAPDEEIAAEEDGQAPADDTSLPLVIESIQQDIDVTECTQDDRKETSEDLFDGACEQDIGETHVDEDAPPPRQGSSGRRRGGGGFYIALIVFCLISSIAILAFAVADRKQEPVLSDTDISDESDQTRQEEASDSDGISTDVDTVYSVGVRSTVTVVSVSDGKTSYFSGTAIFSDGYVVTLCEAVTDAESIGVLLWDGSFYPATVVGKEESVDLALLKVGARLSAATVGDSTTLKTGDTVFAIGVIDAGRLSSSMFKGAVSYAARQIELTDGDGRQIKVEAIQISGLDDVGMRGCPIFNEMGEAVAVALTAGDGSAVTFALPLDKAMAVLEVMKSGETVSKDDLGELAFAVPRLGILGETAADGGVSIKGFSDQSSDAALKLRLDDVIVALGAQTIADTDSLRAAVEEYQVGETVEVFVMRDGQRLSFYVELT